MTKPKFDDAIYIETLLRDVATKKVVPLLNGDISYPNDAAEDTIGSIMLTLWDYGYRPAAKELIVAGYSPELVSQILEQNRPPERDCLGFDYELSSALAGQLEQELQKAWDEDQALEYLTERKSNVIKDFQVLFRSDESKHRGFPHIVAVLKGLEVSISLENPPRILAPDGKIRGVAAALKVIKKNRKALLKEWKASRPDDQKLMCENISD